MDRSGGWLVVRVVYEWHDAAGQWFRSHGNENWRRVKIWGNARVVEDDTALIDRPRVGNGRPERAILFDIEAWDVNCPQHIPRRIGLDGNATLLAERDARIAALETELAARDAFMAKEGR